MKQKCKLLVIAMLSAIILIFGGANYSTTYANGELCGPLNFGFENYSLQTQVYFSDDEPAFIMFDDTCYITSSDVTEVTFSMTDPDGLDVQNKSDIGGYYFEYTKVGTYILTAYLSDGTTTATKEFNISVGKSLDTSLLGTRYDMDIISDTELYQGLQIAFEKLYKDQFGATCNVTGVYSDMFTLVDIDILDLSNLGIDSLNGIHRLNFGNINGINLANNSISSITNEQFTTTYTKIKHLNLSNNEISEIAIDNLTNLTHLNLSNNELTTVDLSKLNIGTATLDLNLAYNNFTTTDDIKLPKAENKYAHININLMSNYIGEPTKDYKENTRLSFTLGFQFKATPVIDTTVDNRVIIEHTDTIYYYKTNVPNLELRLYSITKDIDGANIETHFKTIKESEMTSDIETFTLTCGEYRYKYFIGNEEAYTLENGRRHYRSDVFHCLPNSPEYYFEHNGKTYESISKVTGFVTVHLKDYVSDENITLYYKVNSGDWQEGNAVTVSSGKDTIYVKAVTDNGFESFVVAIDVHTSLNPYVPDFVMLIFVIFLMIALVFVGVPLLGKWINSDKR